MQKSVFETDLKFLKITLCDHMRVHTPNITHHNTALFD